MHYLSVNGNSSPVNKTHVAYMCGSFVETNDNGRRIMLESWLQGVEAGWRSWEEVKTVAANRDKWRDSVKALCATRHKEDR